MPIVAFKNALRFSTFDADGRKALCCCRQLTVCRRPCAEKAATIRKYNCKSYEHTAFCQRKRKKECAFGPVKVHNIVTRTQQLL